MEHNLQIGMIGLIALALGFIIGVIAIIYKKDIENPDLDLIITFESIEQKKRVLLLIEEDKKETEELANQAKDLGIK